MAAFLYIKGVQGDATEANHKGEIELTSVSFITDGGSRGSGAGRLEIREIAAVKKQGRASPFLWKAAASGQLFGFMILDMVHAGKTTRYTMGKVYLLNFQTGHGIETFTLIFETLSIKCL